MPGIANGLSTRRSLARRIDRCYLIAAWTRVATKRSRYLALARHYREVLAALSGERPSALVEQLQPA